MWSQVTWQLCTPVWGNAKKPYNLTEILCSITGPITRCSWCYDKVGNARDVSLPLCVWAVFIHNAHSLPVLESFWDVEVSLLSIWISHSWPGASRQAVQQGSSWSDTSIWGPHAGMDGCIYSATWGAIGKACSATDERVHFMGFKQICNIEVRANVYQGSWNTFG